MKGINDPIALTIPDITFEIDSIWKRKNKDPIIAFKLKIIRPNNPRPVYIEKTAPNRPKNPAIPLVKATIENEIIVNISIAVCVLNPKFENLAFIATLACLWVKSVSVNPESINGVNIAINNIFPKRIVRNNPSIKFPLPLELKSYLLP